MSRTIPRGLAFARPVHAEAAPAPVRPARSRRLPATVALALTSAAALGAAAPSHADAAATMRSISSGKIDRQSGFRVRTSSDGKSVVLGSSAGASGAENPRFAFADRASASSFVTDFDKAIKGVSSWASSSKGTVRALSTGAVNKVTGYRIRPTGDGHAIAIVPSDAAIGGENPRLVFRSKADATAAEQQLAATVGKVWPGTTDGSPAPAPTPAPTPTPTPTPTPAPPTSTTPPPSSTTPPPPPPASDNPTPTGTRIFTGNRLSAWPTVIEAASDRITEATDPLGSSTVLKFTVQDGDTVVSPNPRAQLETGNVVNPGDEVWFGGRVFIPNDFQTPPSDGWITLSSVYGPPYSGASPAPLQIVKAAGDSEPTLGIVSGDWKTRYWGLPLSQIRGKWTTWLIHEKFSANGWMEAWANGKQVMPRRAMSLISSANDGGANHITNTFYRKKGMWQTATLYHADFGVWKVG